MKNFKYILIAAVLVSASCQREEMNMETRVDVTFVASHESRTKTSLVNENVLWESGDQIKILWNGGDAMSEARVGDDRSVAEFSASVPEGYDYYAVSPYAAESSLAGDVLTVVIPQNQTGTFAGANITVAKADAENGLKFRHAVGYVEFTTEKVGTVEFSGAENDVLAGTVTVAGFDGNELPKCSFDGGTAKVSVEVDEPGTYYMAVVPGAELNGFTIRMISDEGRMSASYDQKLVIGRGKLLPLGNITERLKRDGQFESGNEKFEMTDIFEEVKPTGICVPSAVCMDSDLSYLPETVSVDSNAKFPHENN